MDIPPTNTSRKVCLSLCLVLEVQAIATPIFLCVRRASVCKAHTQCIAGYFISKLDATKTVQYKTYLPTVQDIFA